MKRLLAIGDIHGYLEKLEKLIDQIQPTLEDQVVFLGDYIDRGPNSKDVIEYLIRFHRQFPKTVFLLGNHEQMMLDYLQRMDTQMDWTPLRELSILYEMDNGAAGVRVWLWNGGEAVLDEYMGVENIPQEHIDFLLSCQLYFEDDNFVFVHAGLARGSRLEEQDLFDLLWSRDPAPGAPLLEGKTIVVGHTPQRSLEIGDYRINLDSGCGYGPEYPLTCMDLLSGQFWQSKLDLIAE